MNQQETDDLMKTGGIATIGGVVAILAGAAAFGLFWSPRDQVRMEARVAALEEQSVQRMILLEKQEAQGVRSAQAMDELKDLLIGISHDFQIQKLNFSMLQERLDNEKGDGMTFTDFKDHILIWRTENPDLKLVIIPRPRK